MPINPQYMPQTGYNEGAIGMRTTIFQLLSSEAMQEYFTGASAQKSIGMLVKSVLVSEVTL